MPKKTALKVAAVRTPARRVNQQQRDKHLDKLLSLLQKKPMTMRQIGARFGVTRVTVREWLRALADGGAKLQTTTPDKRLKGSGTKGPIPAYWLVWP